jgi:hypothetical protein
MISTAVPIPVPAGSPVVIAAVWPVRIGIIIRPIAVIGIRPITVAAVIAHAYGRIVRIVISTGRPVIIAALQ